MGKDDTADAEEEEMVVAEDGGDGGEILRLLSNRDSNVKIPLRYISNETPSTTLV